MAMESAAPVFLNDTLSARRWRAFVVVSAALLSTTLLLKFLAVQYLEWIYLLNLAVLLRAFYHRRFQLVADRWFLGIAVAFAVLGVMALVFAFASLRFEFYLPQNVSWQTLPISITVQRVIELVCAVSAMVYMAHIFLEEPVWLKRGVQIYVWTAVFSVVYSIVTWPLAYLGVAQMGVYLVNFRWRGFYNEGGPWGLYLVSAIVVGFAMYKRGWCTRWQIWAIEALLVLGLVFSYSKASIAMLLLLLVANAFLAGSMMRRLLMLMAVAAVLVVGSMVVNFVSSVKGYMAKAAEYERVSSMHRADTNFVAGRVAGAFIVPRMIAAHPLTGIGWGNYALLRNLPEYRGASVWYSGLDDPGLGFLAYVAQLGIPLGFYMALCLSLPAILATRRRCPVYVRNVAMIQPLTMFFGAQLNLTYPWVVSAFALGMAYACGKVPTLESSSEQVS